MVRDIVYKNTRETVFSPVGWYLNRLGERVANMESDIHPPAGMHIVVALSMSYYFLVLASTYCSMERSPTTQQSIYSNQTHHEDDDHFDPRALPPRLTPTSSLADISERWSTSIQHVRSSDEGIESCAEYRESHPEAVDRCSFNWIGSRTKIASKIEDIFRPYLMKTSRWKVDVNGHKAGWSPVLPTDRFVFETRIKSTGAAETRSMVLLYMKSWGDKWDNSTAEVKVWNNADTLLARQELLGFHEKQTSEIYPSEFRFSTAAAPNSTVKVEVRLVAGTTFKIMGLAICSDESVDASS
jgi:hypothetical protein